MYRCIVKTSRLRGVAIFYFIMGEFIEILMRYKSRFVLVLTAGKGHRNEPSQQRQLQSPLWCCGRCSTQVQTTTSQASPPALAKESAVHFPVGSTARSPSSEESLPPRLTLQGRPRFACRCCPPSRASRRGRSSSKSPSAARASPRSLHARAARTCRRSPRTL